MIFAIRLDFVAKFIFCFPDIEAGKSRHHRDDHKQRNKQTRQRLVLSMIGRSVLKLEDRGALGHFWTIFSGYISNKTVWDYLSQLKERAFPVSLLTVLRTRELGDYGGLQNTELFRLESKLDSEPFRKQLGLQSSSGCIWNSKSPRVPVCKDPHNST